MKTQRTKIYSDGNRRSIRGHDDSPRIQDDGNDDFDGRKVSGRGPSGNKQHGNNATSFHQVVN